MGKMCNGKIKSIPNAFGAQTSPTKRAFLLLLVLTVLSTGQGSGCMRPYMVQNSWVNLTETNRGSFPVGTVLQYSCDPGYLPDGPSILTCTASGRWSSEPPQCIRSGACLPLSKPENGGYTCHPSPCRLFSHGTIIEFLCNEGFTLSGDYPYLTCQDGQWDGPVEISCVSKGCIRPSMVQHGSANLTDTNTNLFHVGTVLQYNCDAGYLLAGRSILTCTTLGDWSSPPPRCIRSDACPPPPQPENGGYTCHPSPCRWFSHGTVIQYYCNEGYTMKGDYKFRTCHYGKWDDSVPVSCVPELAKGCIRPLLLHGSSNVTDTNRNLFPVGTVLQYSCDPGYLLEGSSILTCTSMRHWSAEPPRCTHTEGCQPPYQLENGGYLCHPPSCRVFPHSTVVEYFCDEGYVLKGDYKYLTCQLGQWNSQIKLSCVMEQDRHPSLPLGMPALSIVASTASSVALVLLLVVLFVLLQPKLKSFHRRDPGVSGQPVSIMVEGVQVTLPSYEEAVSNSRSTAVGAENRVHIVLSEGQHASAPEAGPSRPSNLKQHQTEAAETQPAPTASSSSTPSSSSAWALDHAGAAGDDTSSPESLTGYPYPDVYPSASPQPPSLPPLVLELLRCDPDELVVQNKIVAHLQQEQSNRGRLDKPSTFSLMCRMADQTLFSIVEWARSCIFFKELRVGDQMKLLHNCWSELLVLDHIFRQVQHGKEDSILLVTGQEVQLSSILSQGEATLCSLVQRGQELAARLRALQVDRREIACLKFLLLFNPNVKLLENQAFVDGVQEQVNGALLEYTLTTYPQFQEKFSQLVVRLPELRSLSTQAEDYLCYMHLSGEVPCNNLLIEMLHAKRACV